mmetsp:Transcript_30733/g.52557  ORF Transcript_30733/g.52557 Transcript_30733/m.52557 type:complete len:298 (+) Transcript_30733:54-947(+)
MFPRRCFSVGRNIYSSHSGLRTMMRINFKTYYTEENIHVKEKTTSPRSDIYFSRTPKSCLVSSPATHAYAIANPEKECSEDAFFILDENTFGIADGVGVWSEMGINSSIYSQSLLNHIEDYIREKEDCTLYEALVYGYSKNVKAKIKGSSTVCLAKIIGRDLHALNLGDSSFAIFRDNRLIYQSEVQSHSFNYPYQLGTGGDSPASAHCIQCTLQQDDLIVMATDGLFDNLFNDEIEDVIKASSSDEIATNLAVSAMASACSAQKDTPFSEKVAEETDQIWRGGKLDDITVVTHIVS